MSITQNTVALDGFSGFQRRDRVSSSGNVKSRYTVEFSAAPVFFDLDAKALGEGPATAIADHLRTRVESISVLASPSTQQKRIEAERALSAGKRWATKRYAGGRMGAMAPDSSEGRIGGLFNDSGRLAKGIVARATSSGAWVVNVPANRFDPSTFRDGQAGVIAMAERLRALIPEFFGDTSAIMKVPAIRQALSLAVDSILVNREGAAWKRRKALRAQLRRDVFSIGMRAGQFLGGF